MTDSRSKTDFTSVVTLRTLLGASGVESSRLEANRDPAQQRQIDRYNRILEKLQVETTKTSAGVLITVQDRDASLLQSRIAEGGDAGPPLQAGGLEAQFGDGVTGGDVWGWIRSMFDHIDQTQWHPIVRPPDDNIGTLADTGRVAVLGDWAPTSKEHRSPLPRSSVPAVTNFCCISAISTIPAPRRRSSSAFSKPGPRVPARLAARLTAITKCIRAASPILR